MKLVYWPWIGELLHLLQRGGTGQGRFMPLFAVPNVTSHQSPYCCIMVRCSAVLMCP